MKSGKIRTEGKSLKQPVTLEPAVDQRPFSGSIDTATLELLANWRRQDATDDPEEIRAAERDLAEFKGAMNRGRTLAGEPLLYP